MIVAILGLLWLISLGLLRPGQEDYFLRQAREEYYTRGGEPPGYWLGRGANGLGLRGKVERHELQQLFAGYAPRGGALVQNAGHKTRSVGLDLTLSFPKSVSVLWAVAPYAVRREVEAAAREAVAAVVDYLESTAAITRRGRGGQRHERAGLAAAVFQHCASREGEVQLHYHTVVVNVGLRPDGTTGALEMRPFFHHKMAAGAVGRAAMAAALERRLGLVIQRDGDFFQVAGIPPALLRALSTRRQQILEHLGEIGRSSAAAASVANLATRAVKGEVARREVIHHCRQTASQYGFGPGEVDRLLNRQRRRVDSVAEGQRILQAAAMRLTASASHFTAFDLVRYAAIEAQGRGMTADQVRAVVAQALEASPEFVPLGSWREQEQFTTRAMLGVERTMLTTVESWRNDSQHRVAAGAVERVIQSRPTLLEEQRQAIRQLTGAAGRLQVLTGLAGTGKTYTLDTCREIWDQAGYRVVGAALAGKAARELERGAGIESDTLAMRLRQFERAEAAANGAVASRRGAVATRSPGGLDARTIVVVDEAAMVDSRRMAQLVAAVDRHQAKLVLVGDERQLQPIGPGGAFAAFAQRVEKAELQAVMRQRIVANDRWSQPDWARQAVRQLAHGRVDQALEMFASRGLVHVASDRRAAMERLVDDWSAAGGPGAPLAHVILTTTNAEAKWINQACQTARAQAGRLDLSLPVEVHGQRLFPGDCVMFTEKSRSLGIENGDTGQVVLVNRMAQALVVEGADGKRTVVPLADYDQVRLAYAATTHKLQGASIENVYVLAGGPMQDREMAYVQLSRARGTTQIYTTEWEAGPELAGLAKQMAASRQKTLATDILAANVASAPGVAVAPGPSWELLR